MLRPQFVLFGDSLTQHGFDEGGWGAKLASQYARKADVVLRGYSGYNTVWAGHLLNQVFPPAPTRGPALVTIFFGANDAAIKDGCNDKQHVPVAEYAARIRAMVKHVRSNGVNATIIIAPPPVDEAARRIDRMRKWGLTDEQVAEPDRLNRVTGEYAAAAGAVAAEVGAAFVDTWTEFQKDAGWRNFLSDGLHLTPAGSAVLYTLLQRTIDSQLPHLRFDDLPFDFPLHGDIQKENPEAAFRDRDRASQ